MIKSETDKLIIKTMKEKGGGFVKSLAHAASLADPVNLSKIKSAFKEYWKDYALLADYTKRAKRR